VLGLTVALPTGEIIRTGGRLWKDVAGYDLTRLLTGSEGTLGVITEVTVALLPKPATSRTGLAYFGSLAQAGQAVAGILAAGVIPSTLEFLDRRCIDAVEQYAQLGLNPDAGALLLFGDDGDAAMVARAGRPPGAAKGPAPGAIFDPHLLSRCSASAATVKAGGWMGIVLAGVAFYLTLATVGQATYGREILWLGHLSKK
jgi:FAD linked oxidases, C-terminal domain